MVACCTSDESYKIIPVNITNHHRPSVFMASSRSPCDHVTERDEGRREDTANDLTFLTASASKWELSLRPLLEMLAFVSFAPLTKSLPNRLPNRTATESQIWFVLQSVSHHSIQINYRLNQHLHGNRLCSCCSRKVHLETNSLSFTPFHPFSFQLHGNWFLFHRRTKTLLFSLYKN